MTDEVEEVVLATLMPGSSTDNIREFFTAAALLQRIGKAVSVRFEPARTVMPTRGDFHGAVHVPSRIQLMALKS
jgi:hypothetical protein